MKLGEVGMEAPNDIGKIGISNIIWFYTPGIARRFITWTPFNER